LSTPYINPIKKGIKMGNEDRVQIVVDRKKGTMTVVLPIEDRISGSEKSIIIAGINGSMRLRVGDDECVLACSLYKKNPEYNAVEALKRAEAKKGSPNKSEFSAKLIA